MKTWQTLLEFGLLKRSRAIQARQGPDAGNGGDGEKRLTIIEHLDELRKRLIVCVIAVCITTAISFIFSDWLFAVLKAPAGDIEFQAIEMMELFGTYVKVALFSGLILAIPILLYEIVMYIAPALTPSEKKYFFLFLPGALAFFVLGVVFAYNILLPPAISFLLSFGTSIATPQIRIGNYISTVTRLLLYVGLTFETPLVIFFLSKMRILTPSRLTAYRRHAYVGAFVLAAVITPTFDPVNQTLVAVPLILLYEVGLLLARVA